MLLGICIYTLKMKEFNIYIHTYIYIYTIEIIMFYLRILTVSEDEGIPVQELHTQLAGSTVNRPWAIS